MARIEFPLGAIPVTGSDDFVIIDELAVLGRIVNPSGSLVLSSSVGSDTIVSGNLHVKGGGSVTVDGNVTVGGNVTFVSSSNLLIHDPLIVLALSQSAISPQFDSGFIVERGTGENRAFIWRESDSRFAAVTTDETGSTAGTIPIKGYAPLKVLSLVLHSGTVTADNTHLVLSSSIGSQITISGNLSINNGAATGYIAIEDAGALTTGVRLNSARGAFGAGAGLYLTQDDGAGTGVYMVAQNMRGFNFGGGETDFDLGSLTTFSNPKGLKMGNGAVVKWFGPAGAAGGAVQTTNNTGELLIGRNDSGSLYISGSGGRNEIVAKNSDLILSSSFSSKILVSGTLSASIGFFSPVVRANDIFSGRLTLTNAIVATPYATINQGSDFLFAWTGGTFRKAGYLADIDIQWKSTTTGDATSRTGDDTGLGRQSEGIIYISGSTHGGLTANKGHLILSSSIGNTIAVSGNLKVQGPAGVSILVDPADFASRLNFRTAVNGFLGAVTVDSAGIHIDNSGFANCLNVQATKVRIGASVAGAFPIVEALDVSGSILLQQPHRAMIYATGSDLILSSSTASTIVVSGTLRIKGNTSTTTFVIDNNGSISTPRIDVTDNNDGSFAMTNGGTVAYGQGSGFVWSNNASGNGGSKITRVSQLGTGSIGLSGALGSVTVSAVTGDLIFSASSGRVALSATLFLSGASSNPASTTRVMVIPLGKEFGSETHSGNKFGWNLAVGGGGTGAGDVVMQGNNLAYVVAGGYQWIHRDNGVLFLNTTTPATCKMVLTASGGHIRVSGTLGVHKAVSTALPTGSDEISGSVIWVDDLKCGAIYGPEGWTRIVTGTL